MKPFLLLPVILSLGLRTVHGAPPTASGTTANAEAGASKGKAESPGKQTSPGLKADPAAQTNSADEGAKGVPPQASKKPASKVTAFIRQVNEEDGDKLQVAIVGYESSSGTKVDLVGAIHIADKAYFDALNERFKRYDAVLYELVGPPLDKRDKAALEKHAKSREKLAWVGHLQAKMKEALNLHGQLECIDYTAKNFVHADMDTEKFTDTQSEKKESFFGLYLKAALAQKEAQAKTGVNSDAASVVMLLKLLTSKDSSTGLKRMLAQQFESVGDIMTGMEAGGGTVIVGERNRVALEVMDKQIAAGKKHLAIFYGAAHLGDMETRLKERGFKKTKTEWLTAWDIPAEE